MARGAWVRHIVLVGHCWSNELKRMGAHERTGNTFALDLRHMAGDALAARTAILVVGVLFESCRVWTIR